MRACLETKSVYPPWLDVSPDSNLSKPIFSRGHTQPESGVHLWTHLAVTSAPLSAPPPEPADEKVSLESTVGCGGGGPGGEYSSPPADQLTRVTV